MASQRYHGVGEAHTTVGHLFTYGALLGSAVLVTRVADGPRGVRRLLRRLLLTLGS